MIDASINQGAGGETWSWKVDDTPGVWITWRPSTTGVGFACGFTVE